MISIAAAAAEPGIVLLDEIDSSSQTQFARADALLANGQWREAVEGIQRVLEAEGDRLVEVPNAPLATELEFSNYVTMREQAHRWFASLTERAPEALRIYRQQFDPLAQRFLRDGIEADDHVLLRRIVDEMFASSFGDDALLRLGELARARGDYTLARNYWQRISSLLRYVGAAEAPPVGRDAYPWWILTALSSELSTQPHLSSSSWLAYPDSDLDLDQIRARLVLVSVLAGNRQRASWELERLRKIAPDSSGTIAGRRGLFVDLIAELNSASEQWQPHRADAAWTTFGGSPERFRPTANEFDLGGRPLWTRDLPRLKLREGPGAAKQLRVGERDDGLLSIFPIAIDGAVIYAAGLHAEDLEAIELRTGRVLFARRTLPREQLVPHLPGATTAPRMTLTAVDQTFLALTLNSRGLPARLAALDFTAQRKLLFSIELKKPNWAGNWIFEGTPVADSRSLYVAVRHLEQIRHTSHIACFDIQGGELQWRRLICEAETEPSIASGYLSNLLTLSQGTVYYNSNLGAVAALRAHDGALRWVVTYPRSSGVPSEPADNQLHRFRDLTPCLVHNDIAIVAPRDADRIFALDAISGSLLWSMPAGAAADVVHLLGVADGRLIASGECLYWIDMLSGRIEGQFPSTFHSAVGHARPTPRGYGRGLLAGGNVYWPTHDAIYVFDQRTVKTEVEWQPRHMRRMELAARGATGGNLLLQRGILLIAAADKLYAFNESGIPHDVY